MGELDENGCCCVEEVVGFEYVIEVIKVLMVFGFKFYKMDWLELYGVEINYWGGINVFE